MAAATGMQAGGGALINDVEPGGPAARSGIQPGDVIKGFNGQAVKDGGDLARAVAAAKAGSTVPIKVVRNGRSLALGLRIGGGSTLHS